MNLLYNHYYKIVRQDICLQSICRNPHEVAYLDKIELECPGGEIDNLILLKILGLSQAYVTISVLGRKGVVDGYKLTLRKSSIYRFLQNWINNFLPWDLGKIQDNHSSLDVNIQDLFINREVRVFYLHFENLGSLKIRIYLNGQSKPSLWSSLRIPTDK